VAAAKTEAEIHRILAGETNALRRKMAKAISDAGTDGHAILDVQVGSEALLPPRDISVSQWPTRMWCSPVPDRRNAASGTRDRTSGTHGRPQPGPSVQAGGVMSAARC